MINVSYSVTSILTYSVTSILTVDKRKTSVILSI